jgi:alpha-tubulin suppressor-like RCC1 family protein
MWGQNPYGLLGGTERGAKHVRETPTAVEGLSGATAIAACRNAGAALKADGSLWMWGSDEEGVMATGTITLSGQNGKEYYVPRRVNIQDVSAIACGDKHMLALRKDGTVWSWGKNRYGQLGLGDAERRGTPTHVTALTGVTRIFAFEDMSAAQMKDGSWLVWGSAPSPKATRDEAPPVLTPSAPPGILKDAIEIGEGIALLKDGTVRTWGGNSFGFLGTGGSVDQTAASTRPALVKSLTGIVHVWSGGNRCVALKSDGTLYVWGPYKENVNQRTPIELTKISSQ